MSELPDRQAINALFAGNYSDPFSLLGMHKTENGLEVRALLPEALEVWVIETSTGRKLAQLKCDDARGFSAALYLVVRIPFAINWL